MQSLNHLFSARFWEQLTFVPLADLGQCSILEMLSSYLHLNKIKGLMSRLKASIVKP